MILYTKKIAFNVRRLPTFALRLSSALTDFTSVFEMGTGGAPSV